MADKYIDMNLDDALIEKPYCFSVEVPGKGKRYYYLFPVTLGKMYVLKRHMENLSLNEENIKVQPYLEALRVVRNNKEEVCRVLTYHTLKKKRDIFDMPMVEERTQFFAENLTEEELASTLILILRMNSADDFKRHLGISKEQDKLRELIKYKEKVQKSQNDFPFGCKTIYGTLIDTACERYGWSYDYVLWGISFVNLQLMIADRQQSIFISDEEKKKIPSRLLNRSDLIDADNKENMEKILSMNWK